VFVYAGVDKHLKICTYQQVINKNSRVEAGVFLILVIII